MQQQVLRRLDASYKRFFEAVRAGRRAGAPRFKAYGDERGLRFPDPEQFELDAAKGRVRLPKLGWLRLRMSEPLQGELRNVSITREGSHWYCSLQVRGLMVLPAVGVEPTLGVDVGVALFAATSDGHKIEPLAAFARQQRHLRRCQNAVNRKKKGSSNRRKAVERLGRLHRKIARQRADWLHKLSTELADRHPVIAIENLKIGNMTASATGTLKEPGRNVKAKAGLNRSILDAAWGEFGRQLEYKLAARGGQLVRVNAAYTSQRCSRCGHVDAASRCSQAQFCCTRCGYTDNADVNAANNILAAGHAVWAQQQAVPTACGEDVRRAAAAKPRRATSKKQEPTEGLACA